MTEGITGRRTPGALLPASWPELRAKGRVSTAHSCRDAKPHRAHQAGELAQAGRGVYVVHVVLLRVCPADMVHLAQAHN